MGLAAAATALPRLSESDELTKETKKTKLGCKFGNGAGGRRREMRLKVDDGGMRARRDPDVNLNLAIRHSFQLSSTLGHSFLFSSFLSRRPSPNHPSPPPYTLPPLDRHPPFVYTHTYTFPLFVVFRVSYTIFLFSISFSATLGSRSIYRTRHLFAPVTYI